MMMNIKDIIIDNYLDSDGEVEIIISLNEPHHITKDDALQIIAHLKQVFELEDV